MKLLSRFMMGQGPLIGLDLLLRNLARAFSTKQRIPPPFLSSMICLDRLILPSFLLRFRTLNPSLGVKEPFHRKEHSTSSVRLSFEQEKVYDTREKKESELDRVTYRKPDEG